MAIQLKPYAWVDAPLLNIVQELVDPLDFSEARMTRNGTIPLPTAVSRGARISRAVRAAYSAGADGVVLSRECVEMWNANLSAAGETLRDIFSKQGGNQ